MKHKLQILFAALLAGLVLPLSAQNYDFSAVAPSGQTLYYKIVDGEAHVVRPGSGSEYDNYVSGDLVIPATVTHEGNTYSVTSLTAVSSYGTFENCSGLTSVTIPTSVTSIGAYAFNYCSSMTAVNIPDAVTSIGGWAFHECRNLTSIILPEGITSIDYGAFWRCISLTSITLPKSITYIGNYAFGDCSSLELVNFNATNCSRMGNSDYLVFKGCTSLTTLNIGEEVSVIPSYAFAQCNSIQSVEIPNSVIKIDSSAFSGCSQLLTVAFGNGIKTIGSFAFSACSNLTRTDYNGTIEGWMQIDFESSSSNPVSQSNNLYIFGQEVTNIVIPFGIEEIKDYTFNYCKSLTSVPMIPSSVKRIGRAAFDGCTNMTGVLEIPGSVTIIGAWAFYDCIGISEVRFSEGLTEIGNFVFAYNTFESGNIIIPNTVSIVGSNVFTTYNFSQIDTISIPNTLSTVKSNTFKGVTAKCVILPASIENIESKGLAISGGHYNLISYATTPPLLYSDALTGGDTLFVPCEAVEAYRAESRWNVFDTIIGLGCPAVVTALTSDEAKGSTLGSGTYGSGETATLMALPKQGYIFDGWSNGSMSNPLVIAVGSTDTTVTAFFSQANVIPASAFPTFDFEDDATNAFFTLENGSCTNGWVIGSADNNGGSKGLYISNDGGISNSYNTSISSSVFAYVELDLTEGEYIFQYNWRCQGEGSSTPYDYLRVALVPQSTVLTASTDAPTSWSYNRLPVGSIALDGGKQLNLNADWTTQRTTATITESGVYRLVFFWRNDASQGGTPAAAIDNIMYMPMPSTLYTVSAASADEAKGTVLGSTAEARYGEVVTLTAVPAEHYHLAGWSNGATTTTIDINVTGNTSLTAYFAEDSVQYTISSADEAMGVAYGSGTQAYGSDAAIFAVGHKGYVFSRWSDYSTDNPRVVPAVADISLTAYFVPQDTVKVITEVFDTTIVNLFDTTIVNVFDTTIVKVFDTVINNVYQYDTTIIVNNAYQFDTSIYNSFRFDTTLVFDTVIVNLYTYDTAIYNNYRYDTVMLNHYQYDTTLVNVYDTVINNIYQFDTVVRNVYQYDTTLVTNNLFQYDTAIYNHFRFDTTLVFDTVIVNLYTYDTSIYNNYRYDTVVLNRYQYDTTLVNVYDTTIVNRYQYDTMLVNVYDTTIVNHYQYDTTLVNIYDTVINNVYQYDTVIRNVYQYDTTLVTNNLFQYDTAIYNHFRFDTTLVFDTVIVNLYTYDTSIYNNYRYDTVVLNRYQYDTTLVNVYDTVINNIYQFDTVIRNVYQYDTTLVTNNLFQYDTAIYNHFRFDTTLVFDTVIVNLYTYDTTLYNNYRFDTVVFNRYQYDTTLVNVYDTTIVNHYQYDTMLVNVYDTTIVNHYQYDTMLVNVYDTTIVNHYQYDTTLVSVYDTTIVNRYQYDTVVINNYVFDTVVLNNYYYDTVNNTYYDTVVVSRYYHDTVLVNNYVFDTIYLNRYIFDTVYLHDTVYITTEGIDEAEVADVRLYQRGGQLVVEGAEGRSVTVYDAVGRVMAARRDEYMSMAFDIPASGIYLVKIGDMPARRIVAIR